MTETRMPAVFAGHGSPMLALEHTPQTEELTSIGGRIIAQGRPKAILAISAHWYTRGTFIQSAPVPKQVYDMYGFPQELYNVKYPVKGYADLTKEVQTVLGNDVQVNDDWGIDHGTWTVLVHMFPLADIPVVQLSVSGFLDAQQSWDLGKKLAVLRDKGYLLFASGNVVHNLGRVDWDNPDGSPMTKSFNDAIRNAVINRDDAAVIHYSALQYSDYAAPAPEHFLPLLYILGASEGEKPVIFNDVTNLGAISMTSYAFGLK